MTECLQSPDHKPCHPELVSGSISPRSQAAIGAWWMLNQVQHDGGLDGLVAYRGQSQIHREINPLRVFRFNKVDLPRAMPIFELLFPRNSRSHVVEHFKAHKSVHRIFRGMSRRHVVSVLVQALDEVRGYADVKRTVGSACEYVDAGLFRFAHGLCMDLRWTLKQVQGDELGAFGRE